MELFLNKIEELTMVMVNDWEYQFDLIVKANDNRFGHNIEFSDARKYFKKLENCSHSGELEILDEYTARITLPPEMSAGRDNALLYILTTSPLPSECRFNKKKDQLTIEWHY